MNAIARPIPITAERALRFKAWIVGSPKEPHARHEACPAPVPSHCLTEQEVADSIASELFKDRRIMVLRTDDAERPERRNLVSLFDVKRKRTSWSYPEFGGRAKAVYTCFGVLRAQFCVGDGFRPVEPFRVTRETTHAEVVGHDLTLVSQ